MASETSLNTIAKQLYECLAALSATYGIGISARDTAIQDKWAALGESAISDLESVYELWGGREEAASGHLLKSNLMAIKCLKQRIMKLQTLTNSWTDSLRLIKLQLMIEKRWLNVLSGQACDGEQMSEINQLAAHSNDRSDGLVVLIAGLTGMRQQASQKSQLFEKSVEAMHQLAKGKNV